MVSECFEHHLNPAGSGLLGSFLRRTPGGFGSFSQDSGFLLQRASQISSRFCPVAYRPVRTSAASSSVVSTSREASSASRCVWASGRRSCRLQNKLVSVQRVLRKTACVLTPNRLFLSRFLLVQGIVDRLDMNGQDPVTPMTALVVDDEGRLTTWARTDAGASSLAIRKFWIVCRPCVQRPTTPSKGDAVSECNRWFYANGRLCTSASRIMVCASHRPSTRRQ